MERLKYDPEKSFINITDTYTGLIEFYVSVICEWKKGVQTENMHAKNGCLKTDLI